MKICETIQEKLVSGEELAPEEQNHLDTCEDCRSFQATAQALARSGEAVRGLEEAPAKDIQAVKEQIASRVRPARAAVRLAWASAAMLVGIVGTVMVLSGVFGQKDHSQTEERFLTLLDEVSDITVSAQEEAGFDVADTTLYSVALLFEEELTSETKDLELPGAYELLEEGLQEG